MLLVVIVGVCLLNVSQVSAVVHWWGSEGNSNADVIITNDLDICETHYLLKHSPSPAEPTTPATPAATDWATTGFLIPAETTGLCSHFMRRATLVLCGRYRCRFVRAFANVPSLLFLLLLCLQRHETANAKAGPACACVFRFNLSHRFRRKFRQLGRIIARGSDCWRCSCRFGLGRRGWRISLCSVARNNAGNT